MTNEELVEQIQSGFDVKANMELLYRQNKGLIYQFALKYAEICEIDDLLQEAYFGLYRAVESYKSELGYKFTTYATHHVKQSLRRYSYKNTHKQKISENFVVLISSYNKFRNEYKTTHNGNEPSMYEYMAILNITEKRYKTLIATIKTSNIISLDSNVKGTENLMLVDTIADDVNIENDVVDSVSLEKIHKTLWECVDSLESKHQYVIKRYYKDNISLENIAKEDNTSRSNIDQLRKKGLKDLRRDTRLKQIGELYGYDCQLSYKYSLDRFKTTWTSSTEYVALSRIEKEMLRDEEKRKKKRKGYVDFSKIDVADYIHELLYG